MFGPPPRSERTATLALLVQPCHIIPRNLSASKVPKAAVAAGIPMGLLRPDQTLFELHKSSGKGTPTQSTFGSLGSNIYANFFSKETRWAHAAGTMFTFREKMPAKTTQIHKCPCPLPSVRTWLFFRFSAQLGQDRPKELLRGASMKLHVSNSPNFPSQKDKITTRVVSYPLIVFSCRRRRRIGFVERGSRIPKKVG